MKIMIPALVAAMMAGGGAYAQTLEIGPGGVTVDPRSPRDRAIEREIRREERAERWERRRVRSDCRLETVVRETPRGEVRRTREVCD
ncbi:hypothetical protein ASG72_16060 [Bosea sp. Leaf344]|uniref:hypothetical protein n=1 Tax=Bosea sp. Leaf344 TaxID=1736346 RepID=UPI0006F80592|nr:hypothetical protein [Bosea sp. Leaf344]KQU51272.1 hypothetical protein ASG72_16060 [Bosea sp. Leaf344]